MVAVKVGTLLLGLAACGDPVVGTEYVGEPLFTLGGIVRHEDDQPLPDGALYVTILFEVRSEDGYSWLPPLQVETSFPASYVLNIYVSPPDDLLKPTQEGLLAIGAPMLYVDVDGDGSFNPDVDLRAGTSDGVVVMYLSEPQATEGDPDAMVPGFQAVDLKGGCPGAAGLESTDPLGVDLIVALDVPGVLDHCRGGP